MQGRDIIIFLSVGKIFVADDGRILQFELPNGSVRDWDVLNKESLQDALSAFINANNLQPSQITFVLSEGACFSQDIILKDPSKLDEETEKFLDAVPFNYIISKAYRIANGARVVAANRDLIEAISEVFEGKGFALYAVVPAAIFPQVGAKKELDMQFVKAIEGAGDTIRISNMIAPKPVPQENPQAVTPVISTNKASSGYLPYLIGVGAVAIIVLVALVLLRK